MMHPGRADLPASPRDTESCWLSSRFDGNSPLAEGVADRKATFHPALVKGQVRHLRAFNGILKEPPNSPLHRGHALWPLESIAPWKVIITALSI